MVRYNKLFSLLALKGLKKTDLLEVISSPTLAKLSKGEIIKTDILDRICLFLECQPSDIMEVYDIHFDEDGKTKHPLKITSVSYYDYGKGKSITNYKIVDMETDTETEFENS